MPENQAKATGRNKSATERGQSRDSATGRAIRPVTGFKYRVVCAKLNSITSFQSVGGLEQEVDVVSYREGDWPITVIKYPGLATYPSITLAKGVSSDTAFIEWYEQVCKIMDTNKATSASGLPDPSYRMDMTIELYDRAGQIARSWIAKQAWPSKLSWGDLDAESSDILIHTMEINHEGLVSF